jgi:hypothetical protein
VAQAFCRYGPGTAYLYSHGLYMGDTALVDGRNASGTWLWLKPFNLNRHCWAAASVVDVSGDQSVPVVTSRLPFTDDYGPPKGVKANRDGDEVTVTWQDVPMTVDDDRGFLLEVFLCQDGLLRFFAVQTDDNHFVFRDESGCSQPPSGLLYTVSKHGYSNPVQIPWP